MGGTYWPRHFCLLCCCCRDGSISISNPRPKRQRIWSWCKSSWHDVHIHQPQPPRYVQQRHQCPVARPKPGPSQPTQHAL
ncbi:hypothetical protein LZ30DRAFT_736677 [Colletotrichum cereale]|nr:hypothetical protein LZ30DRAFT_736677 [Colletotrichum cereale]